MSRAFENDPRLKHMDPGRLSALQSLAKELEAAPGDQKMAAFLSASQKAAREHVSFSAEESRSRSEAGRTDAENQARCITKRGCRRNRLYNPVPQHPLINTIL